MGHSVIFVTHDVREADTLADRVIVMDKNPGRVKKLVAIDLRRPRNLDDTGFHEQSKALYELIRSR